MTAFIVLPFPTVHLITHICVWDDITSHTVGRQQMGTDGYVNELIPLYLRRANVRFTSSPGRKLING